MSNPQNPEWLEATNREGESFDLPSVVPLDFDSLVNAAKAKAGLDDFGEDYWQAPLKMLCDDLNTLELKLQAQISTIEAPEVILRADKNISVKYAIEVIEIVSRNKCKIVLATSPRE